MGLVLKTNIRWNVNLARLSGAFQFDLGENRAIGFKLGVGEVFAEQILLRRICKRPKIFLDNQSISFGVSENFEFH